MNYMIRKQFFLRLKRILSFLMVILYVQIINAQKQDLDYYLTTGLNNSPLLKDYRNRIKSALIDSMRLRAGQGFQINASSINSYAPVIHGWGHDEAITDKANLSALIGISKEITRNSTMENRYQAVRLQNQSTFLQSSLSQKDLKKEIIRQYIIAYGDQQNYLLNSEVLILLRQEEQIVKRLTEQGVYKQTEYLSFLVNLHQQELITSQSDYQFKSNVESLNFYCGIFDTAKVTLSEPVLTVNSFAEVNNTVFYRQFMTDSLMLINTARQIDFGYRPKLSVYADGGYLSSLAVTPWKNFGASVGLSLTMPVYDGRQRKMQLGQLAISELTRSNYVSFFKNQYYQQISMLKRQLNSLNYITNKTREQLKYIQALIDANRVLLNSGDIPVTDYLISVNNYLTARGMMIENDISGFNLINEINYWCEK